GCDVIVLSVKVKEIRLDLPRNIISEKSTEVEFLDDSFLYWTLSSKNNDVLQGSRIHIVGQIGWPLGGADPAPDTPVMNGIDQIGLEDEPADPAGQHGIVQSSLPELPYEVEVLEFLTVLVGDPGAIYEYGEAATLGSFGIKYVKAPGKTLPQ